MTVLYFILFLAAFVCLLLAGLNIAVRRINLVGLGLALFVLVFLIQSFNKV